jgi:molecular chaperone DnaJ
LGGIFEDLFGGFGFDLFGGSGGTRAGRRKRKGQDVHYEYEVTLEEAAVGVSKSVTFSRYEHCSTCDGSGAQPGSKRINCTTCSGRGQVVSGMGFINISQTCPSCQGEGVIISAKCKACRGQGVTKVEKNVKVNIPAGIDTGSVLRLRDEGHYGAGGYGDLYLHLQVARHSVFERRGSDLKCTVTVPFTQAVLGAEVEVPTLMGRAKMKVPAGTQPNTIFRLKGKGIVDLRTKHLGDQLVEVEIEVPKRVSPREKKLIEELEKLRLES